MYDISDVAMESAVQYIIDPGNRFFGVYEGEELVGFCSIGTDGRVPGRRLR
jgi:hypothetical protein